MKEETSWGGVADWYDELVQEKSSYQKDLILPNIIRLIDIKKGEKVLDLACGQGFFSGEFLKQGAEVIGSDISEELISLAEKNNQGKDIKFYVSPADNLNFISDKSLDKIVIILAIQNMENLVGVMKECGRVLKDGGKMFFVLNHPVLRIPKETSWGYDEEEGVQYRRLNKYMSEFRTEIDMNPGDRNKKFTVSFHRPLQLYFKALRNSGFCVSGLEEWISNKKSQPGARADAENKSRKEFPLFMMIEATKK